MSDIIPQRDGGARTSGRVHRGPRGPIIYGRDSSLGSSRAQTRPASMEGLRIVLHEYDRRGAVLRCLSSARWLAMRGAELLLVDGAAGRASADGTRAAVARRFPGVRVVPSPRRPGVQALLDCYSAPLPGDLARSRSVLHISCDLEVARFRVEGLLRELWGQCPGTVLVPGLIGTDGAALASSRQGAYAWPKAWMARARDLAGGGGGQSLRFVPAGVSLVSQVSS